MFQRFVASVLVCKAVMPSYCTHTRGNICRLWSGVAYSVENHSLIVAYSIERAAVEIVHRIKRVIFFIALPYHLSAPPIKRRKNFSRTQCNSEWSDRSFYSSLFPFYPPNPSRFLCTTPNLATPTVHFSGKSQIFSLMPDTMWWVDRVNSGYHLIILSFCRAELSGVERMYDEDTSAPSLLESR